MPTTTSRPKYYIETYGCQMNYSDTERLQTVLNSLGFEKTENEKNASLIMMNTCSVRQKAEDRVLGRMKKIKNYKKENPDLLLGLTGCMVRTSSSRLHEKENRDKLLNMLKMLDFVIRIEDIGNIGKFITNLQPNMDFPETSEGELGDYFNINPHITSKKQVFVPIGTGCDKFCTYCIVPYTRGRERSRTVEEINEEAKRFVENGAVEITLIGQTVNSYGLARSDNKKFMDKNGTKIAHPFTALLKKLDTLSKKGLKRLRFTSPYAPDVSDKMIEAMANLKTLMPYIHLPIQSGDNRTLRRMNRKYTVEFYRELIARIRARIPDIAISTDIIVGFCGETEEEFENTCRLYKEIKWDHCYLAQYSPRTGTTSEKFFKDDIPREVKRERWHKLNSIMTKISAERLAQFVGRKVRVLVESQRGRICTGRSEHFKQVTFLSDKKIIGEIVPVKITRAREWILEGQTLHFQL